MMINLKENDKFKKIINFFNKDNYTKTKLILVAVLSAIAAIIFEYAIYIRFIDGSFISKNRIILVSLIFMFIGIHFVFKLSEMYEWIYKNRYKLACAFLLFVCIFKYSGSSIVNYNDYVQNISDDRRYHALLGFPRLIRTDEWASSTMYTLSQGVVENKYEYFSDALRGTTTDMFTLVSAPVHDILMVGKPFQIAYMIFGNDVGLSFYWYAKLVAMMLGSFELCMILTDKKKRVSLCGMIMITFSAAVQWWYCMDTLIWGQIILVLINKFMTTDKKLVKYLCAGGLVSSVLSYIFVLYPAWQVSFAYVFIAIFIWMMIKNLKTYKFNLHDIVVILVSIACVGGLLARWYMLSGDTIKAIMNTDYPGARSEVGGGAFTLYSYFYNIFFPYKHFPNECEYSSMLSFYPIPMFLGLLYLIKNKKHWSFFVPTLAVGVFLTIWCKYGFPEILAKVTLLSMSTAQRATIALGTINIYMLIYLMGTITNKDKWIKKESTYIITALVTAYIAYQAVVSISDYYQYLGWIKIVSASILFGLAIFGILNINNEKMKNKTMYCLMFIAIITGICVNPVIRTTDIIYDKPIAIELQKIREEESDAIWLGDDTGIFFNNYMVANGLRTINSTNVYPNLEFFEELFGDRAEELRSVYNRYAHINVDIIDGENDVYAAAGDNLVISINYKDLERFGIDYIVAKRDLNKQGFDMEFELLYSDEYLYEGAENLEYMIYDNLYIFKPVY